MKAERSRIESCICRKTGRQRPLFLLLLLLPLLLTAQAIPALSPRPIRVACVGASTTYGATIENRPLNAFPAQLQGLLGNGWEVRNFGVNSAGVLEKGEVPYRKTAAFPAALAFQPDIVILNLGVNDVKPVNWKYKADFLRDYQQLIADFQRLPAHPKIYLCREIPVFRDQWGITARAVLKELLPLKRKLARQDHLSIIDLYTPLLGKAALFGDGIHPDAAGAAIMAGSIAAVLKPGAQRPSLASSSSSSAGTSAGKQPAFPGIKSNWRGFDRYDFFDDLRAARLVVPKKPAPGHPWVWRARFPDWHTDMDSILLAHGFYIFYLDTDGLLGAPTAIDGWDQVYRYLRQYYHLNAKVALEGVSRGALFIYGFAKRFPDRVSCIYAEAPVCDIKSWPGGLMRSPGDSAIWQDLLRAYHLTNAEAVAYADNPIDRLEELARRKIPIWHSIGLRDSLAPPVENTFVLAKRYIELGGPITIYPNTKSPVTLHGHHFDIDDPMAGARFIMDAAASRQPQDHTDRYRQ